MINLPIIREVNSYSKEIDEHIYCWVLLAKYSGRISVGISTELIDFIGLSTQR